MSKSEYALPLKQCNAVDKEEAREEVAEGRL